ncbi:hypothetical protein KZ483_10990 [Paenibacillus sp. sptzw28]|nr:hypothetical protein [Paenibacillus sp. sptzw28]QYR23388.1 hypothetical protein KZ483_10990 [Paenibacillus sp. sptzw28]
MVVLFIIAVAGAVLYYLLRPPVPEVSWTREHDQKQLVQKELPTYSHIQL